MVSLIQSTTCDLFIELAVTPTSDTFEHIPHSLDPISDDEDYSEYSNDESSDDDTPTMELLFSLTRVDEDLLLYNHGYDKATIICDSLQGTVLHALNLNATNDEDRYVAIKKTDKQLFAKSIAIEDGFDFSVTENIVKEAMILKHLTNDHTPPIAGHIVQYVDFFQSQDYYYLVMEHIASEITLKQFISEAKQHIQNDRMDLQTYQKTIKVLLWQLFVTVQWLHLSMKCCHLDLCSENILLEHANFIETEDGIRIDHEISIKLCDFGVAELFKKGYLCAKQPLSLENTAYSSPSVFEGVVYDARAADNWSLGMLLFECMTIGSHIYSPLDIHGISYGGGYRALERSKLKRYLGSQNMLKYFNAHSFSMLTALLNFNEETRLKGMEILKHKWFNKYLKRDKSQIVETFSRAQKGLSNMDLYYHL